MKTYHVYVYHWLGELGQRELWLGYTRYESGWHVAEYDIEAETRNKAIAEAILRAKAEKRKEP